MKALNPKLAKVIALWRRTEHDGERQAARASIETLAAQSGMTFEEVIRQDEAERHAATPNPNIFAGFDDFMEAEEPGHKSQRAQEKARRNAARAARKKALIEKHDSEEAALAPCKRERLLLAAVKRWRKASKPPHQRWTDSLDGWSNTFDPMPVHVEAAIRGAYALPETFAAARSEYDYWRMREVEMQVLLNGEYDDCALDLVCEARMRIVERLILFDLIAKDAADVLARFRFYRENEYHSDDAKCIIFNDLDRILTEAAAHLSDTAPVDTSASPFGCQSAGPGADRITATVQRGQIEAAIFADPARSDRSVAREFRCSPTTVGKVRVAAGLNFAQRRVQRGGQMFSAIYAPRNSSGSKDMNAEPYHPDCHAILEVRRFNEEDQ